MSRWVWIILLAGLLLRLAYAAAQPTYTRHDLARGGDAGWYLTNGYGFFSGKAHGWVQRTPFYIERLPTPPLYIIFAGLVQQFADIQTSVVLMRLLQCLASIATVYLAARICLLITGDQRAVLAVAILAAFHPSLVIEPANIATETVYICFLALGFWLYMEYVTQAGFKPAAARIGPKAAISLTGMALALAALTRAVAVLFPFALVIHLLLLGRWRRLDNWRSLSLLLIVFYAAVVSTWTIYNVALWDRIVIVSDQLLPALWRGAETDDGSPAENDALLNPEALPNASDDCHPDCRYQHPAELYIERIRALAGADLAGFFARRSHELAASLIQPHGTTAFGQVSIRDAAGDMLRQGITAEGALEILKIEGFALKLAAWLFHLAAIGFGLHGMWLSRRRIELAGPLIAFALYTLAAHLFLLALPRYLFPLEFIWLIFAGISLVALFDRLSPGKAGLASDIPAQT